MLNKIKSFVLNHKIITIIIFVVILIVCYFVFFKNKNNTETRYVTSVVERGSINSTVTGIGQVEALDVIDLKPKTSGDITYIGVKVGQEVKKGSLIASVDARDAKINMENAEISLARLLEDPDSSTVSQKTNSITKTYNDAWDLVSSTITKMDIIISDLEDLYNTGYLSYSNRTSLSKSSKETANISENSFYVARKSLSNLNKYYKSINSSKDKDDIDKLLNDSSETAKLLSVAIKDSQNLLSYIVNNLDGQDSEIYISTKSNLATWLSNSNGFISSFLSIKNNILSDEQSLNDLIEGSDSLDIRSAELNLQSKKDAYNDSFLRAPFDGVIASLTAKVGESTSSSIGTLITKQKIALITLNEVDIASVKVGQKVDLTFDAISDLVITGSVFEVNPIGAVSQGVVTYSIKIVFDFDDERIKPGMSASATIVTNTVSSVLVVPNNAIKTLNGKNFIQTFDRPISNSLNKSKELTSAILPNQIEVELGLIDDNFTEIISGIKEGDIIIVRTIAGNTTTKTTTKAPSIMNAVGGSQTQNRIPGSGSFVPRN